MGRLRPVMAAPNQATITVDIIGCQSAATTANFRIRTKATVMLRRILPALLIAASVLAGYAAHAQEQPTGMFRLTRSPAEIESPEFAAALDEFIGKDEQLQWQIFVPDSYNPQRPAGIFVYLDPDGHGRMPDEWRQVFTNHNMIWVGVKRIQPRTNITRQTWQAVLGARAIEQDYAIDIQRMYLGGSLGTVPIALSTMLVANEFSGAVYVRYSFYSDQIGPDEIAAMQRKSHVFITGTNDERKHQIRSDYESYQKAGIEKLLLIFDNQRLGPMPSADNMDEAFGFFNAQLRR